MPHTVPQRKDHFHFHSPLLNKASACLLLDIHRRGIFSSVMLTLSVFELIEVPDHLPDSFAEWPHDTLFRSINRPQLKVDEHPRLTCQHSPPP